MSLQKRIEKLSSEMAKKNFDYLKHLPKLESIATECLRHATRANKDHSYQLHFTGGDLEILADRAVCKLPNISKKFITREVESFLIETKDVKLRMDNHINKIGQASIFFQQSALLSLAARLTRDVEKSRLQEVA